MEFKLDAAGRMMLFAVISAIFLAALDQTVVSAALPAMAKDLGGLKELPWAITSYLLMSTVSLPIYGKLGDLYGRKPILIWAITLFLIGSLLSGLAQNMIELALFRGVQGAGGGGLIVLSVAAIADFIPGPARGRYQGAVGATFAVATVLGPFLGGFLVDALSWRWVFLMNIPVAVASMVIITTAFPRPKVDSRPHIDWIGAFLLSAGLSGVILQASLLDQLPIGSAGSTGLIVASLISLATFIAAQRRHPDPLLPPWLFKSRTFSASVAASFFVGIALLGSISFLPTYLQEVRGFSPTQSGLEMLFMFGGITVMSVISGRRVSKGEGYRRHPMIGMLLVMMGMASMAFVNEHTPMPLIDLILVQTGMGIGMTMQVLLLTAQYATDRKYLGVATASASMARSSGGVLGVAMFGAVFAHLVGKAPDGEAKTMAITHALNIDFGVAAALALVGFGILFLIEETRHESHGFDSNSTGFAKESQ